MKYLDISNRKKFEERIRTKYILNEDYIINRLNNKLMSGVRDAFYMISFDGFEKMAMKSNTKKRPDVSGLFYYVAQIYRLL